MGEADWWLCVECQSLNSLSAGKCYSCRAGKPRGAVRASQYLNYQPVESWDGKISLRTLDPPATPPDGIPAEAPAEAAVPRIRDPIPRSILAIAPRAPEAARITYRDVPVEQARRPPLFGEPTERPPLFGPAPRPPLFGTPAAPLFGTPAAPSRGEARMVPVGPAPPRPVQAPPLHGPPVHPPPPHGPPVHPPPEPSDAITQHEVQQRSHWPELLDGPPPDGRRLRDAYAAAEDSDEITRTGHQHDGLALHHAIGGVRSADDSARDPAIEWPEADQPNAAHRQDQEDEDRDTLRSRLRAEPSV